MDQPTMGRVRAFEQAWREIIATTGAEDPYARGFERAMRLALGDEAAQALIERVATAYLSGVESA
ncbi:MAG: hypothetical protein IT337_07860 [Thermomicrobiales bacterium]|nr:hypothetical protein [Thermomicrobiales bacterium]